MDHLSINIIDINKIKNFSIANINKNKITNSNKNKTNILDINIKKKDKQ